MKKIEIIDKYCKKFIPKELMDVVTKEVNDSYNELTNGNGQGNNFLGWKTLPSDMLSSPIVEMIKKEADVLRKKIDVLVVIGIGGSYLGAKAIIEASTLFSSFSSKKICFIGNNINGTRLFQLMKEVDKKEYALIVISKSGTTLEPAVAFRVLKQHIENKYGNSAKERIIVITDKSNGILFNIAKDNNYKRYVIPDNIGGRFSVFTPVGLLPVSVAGVDISELLKGAKDMSDICLSASSIEENPALQYAIARYCLYVLGYDVELLVNYLDQLNYTSEWWKQLFGESEGKEKKGLFPASLSFTTDLHSLGQFIQDGSDILFETIIHVNKVKYDTKVPFIDSDADGLNYISGYSLHKINKIAEHATIKAHYDGGVPNVLINVPEINEYYLGQLLYMFEFACGIGGYLLHVNPFDQPGVENYKKNMSILLRR